MSINRPSDVGEPQLEPRATLEGENYHNVLCDDGVRRNAISIYNGWCVTIKNTVIYGIVSLFEDDPVDYMFVDRGLAIPNLLCQCMWCSNWYLEHKPWVNAFLCWNCRKPMRNQMSNLEQNISVIADYLEDYGKLANIQQLVIMFKELVIPDHFKKDKFHNLDYKKRFDQVFVTIHKIIRKLGQSELAQELYQAVLPVTYLNTSYYKKLEKLSH